MFGWGWGRWFLVLLGVLYLASYLGWLSWRPVENAIRTLAVRPGVPEVFRDMAVGRTEALFVLLSFLLLTPLAALVGLFLFVFLLMILAGTFGPLWRLLGLPQWALVALVVLVLGGVAYAKNEMWLPRVLRISALVAQAYLSTTR